MPSRVSSTRVPILTECGRTVDSTRFAAASRASRSHSDRVAASRANSDLVESQLQAPACPLRKRSDGLITRLNAPPTWPGRAKKKGETTTALSLLFVKSKTAHSASSKVIIQQMWILRKFVGFARCGHSPSACTSARVFRLLQYAGKTGPSRILCVSEV